MFTSYRRQANGSCGVAKGHPLVETQQGDVVVKIQEVEVPGQYSDHVSSVSPLLEAPVVFAERDLDHEPHEPENDTGKADRARLEYWVAIRNLTKCSKLSATDAVWDDTDY